MTRMQWWLFILCVLCLFSGGCAYKAANEQADTVPGGTGFNNNLWVFVEPHDAVRPPAPAAQSLKHTDDDRRVTAEQHDVIRPPVPQPLKKVDGDRRVPDSLQGSEIIFSDRWKFVLTTPNRGEMIEETGKGMIVTPFRYTYRISGRSKARLALTTMTTMPTRVEFRTTGFRFNFTADGDAGTFVASEYDEKLNIESQFGGAFHIEGQKIEMKIEMKIECRVPDSLQGSEITFNDRWKFFLAAQNRGELIEETGKGMIVTPFSYTYRKSGRSKARLVLTFSIRAGFRTMVYNFNFTADGDAGTFVASEYEKGNIEDRLDGTFHIEGQNIEMKTEGNGPGPSGGG